MEILYFLVRIRDRSKEYVDEGKGGSAWDFTRVLCIIPKTIGPCIFFPRPIRPSADRLTAHY